MKLMRPEELFPEARSCFPKPASVMVWAEVSATSQSPLIFVEKGIEVNTDFYLEEDLKKELLPWLRGHFKISIQLLNKSKKVQRWCHENLSDFIDAN
ncbi:hypothetical protein ANCDUO_17227 [Ancylostoma duodenale]|uniref:Uncharacterized protein n=1 Tax=Ancylostoma duodenale TaxID=51022 RepID=A0A0C2G184_9BILA|nr:hypothetical protein ANCDUO_17227 [Ancylostoma duodenale]